MIGAATAQYFADKGIDVVSTSRREPVNGDGRIFLDLAAAPSTWGRLPDADCWIVAGAIARLAACREDPETSRRVNVEAPAALAELAADRGAHLSFLSTDKVFDGAAAARTADAAVGPTSVYGRQKADAEKRVLGAGPHTSVIRLTKVLDPDNPLILGWLDALSNNRRITPFSNMFMAPVSLALVTEAIHAVSTARGAGIFQVSGPYDISYLDAARHIAGRVGADDTLIDAKKAGDAGILPEENPPHTSLDTRIISDMFGLRPAAPYDLLDSLYDLRAQLPA